MSIKLLSASVFALAVTLASVPAFADITITEKHSVTVQFGDLDLSTRAGAHELLARISRAAAIACDPGFGVDLPTMSATRECVNNAIDQAVAEVGSPLLAEARGTSLAGASVAGS